MSRAHPMYLLLPCILYDTLLITGKQYVSCSRMIISKEGPRNPWAEASSIEANWCPVTLDCRSGRDEGQPRGLESFTLGASGTGLKWSEWMPGDHRHFITSSVVEKIPTHLVTRSVEVVLCVGSKGETHRKSVFPLYMVLIDPYLCEMTQRFRYLFIETQSPPGRFSFHSILVSMFTISCQGSFSLV